MTKHWVWLVGAMSVTPLWILAYVYMAAFPLLVGFWLRAKLR